MGGAERRGYGIPVNRTVALLVLQQQRSTAVTSEFADQNAQGRGYKRESAAGGGWLCGVVGAEARKKSR